MIRAFLLISCFLAGGAGAAIPFSLTDSDPNSPEFRRRFLASYGVNEAIEPSLANSDRSLYQRVAPLLSNSPTQAIQIVRENIKADSNAAFDFLLGNLYYQTGNFVQARSALENAVRKFPSFRRAYRTLALTFVQQGDFAGAVAPWLQVISLGGGDAQSYGLLAYSHLQAGQYESSLASYRMARMFRPDSLDFRRGQAHCLFETRQYELAIALLDELIEEYPEDGDFWLLQANAFVARGETVSAIANLELVADNNLATLSSLILLGDLYLNDDLVALAVKTYGRAIQKGEPDDFEHLLRPLNALLERNFYAEARDFLGTIQDRLAGGVPTSQTEAVSLIEARIELEIGDPEKALPVLKASLEKDPLNGPVLLTLGRHALDQSEFLDAERYFEWARSVPAFTVDALVGLGRLAVAQGDFSKAVTSLREAQELQPQPNVARYLEAVEQRVRLR